MGQGCPYGGNCWFSHDDESSPTHGGSFQLRERRRSGRLTPSSSRRGQERERRRSSSRDGSDEHKALARPGQRAVIWLKHTDVGALIGRKGQLLWEIRVVTGAHIHVQPWKEEEEHRSISISPPEERRVVIWAQDQESFFVRC